MARLPALICSRRSRLYAAAWWSASTTTTDPSTELVEKKVLDLTHRHCDTFVKAELLQLRAIDVDPDDKETIAIYRSGAAEAEMEWLPFLRKASDLFLQGVEQGVYAPITTVDP